LEKKPKRRSSMSWTNSQKWGVGIVVALFTGLISFAYQVATDKGEANARKEAAETIRKNLSTIEDLKKDLLEANAKSAKLENDLSKRNEELQARLRQQSTQADKDYPRKEIDGSMIIKVELKKTVRTYDDNKKLALTISFIGTYIGGSDKKIHVQDVPKLTVSVAGEPATYTPSLALGKTMRFQSKDKMHSYDITTDSITESAVILRVMKSKE